jgi:ABC-type multidrug transport system ATPase subunit
VARPRPLLLDEPSMGLVPILVDQIFAIIRKLKAEGLTMLLVEQNAYAALAIADRVYVLETGRVTASGTAADIRSIKGCARPTSASSTEVSLDQGQVSPWEGRILLVSDRALESDDEAEPSTGTIHSQTPRGRCRQDHRLHG